jgi:uroporphyrinogen decarboxylase
MPSETMTSRERWLAVLQRREPDRVPMDYSSTAEASAKLKAYLGLADDSDVFTRLHIDRPYSVGGRYVGPPVPAKMDVYGVQYRDIDYGGGSYPEAVVHPLAEYDSVTEIETNYRWPQADWWDYSHLPRAIRGWEDSPISGGGSEPFLIYKYLRGDEQAFLDLIDNPEIVHYCLDKLFKLAYQNSTRIYEAIPGRVLFSFVAEDMGSQEGLLFSPAQIHEFLLPGMKRMIDLAHQAGVYVFHHSDGAIIKIIPDMISAGIDVLNPVQWRCKNMDRTQLKRKFGSQLIFHGAMDNQYTLAFGQVDEVRQEVVENMRILGENGGYIMAPCHNIQTVSPAENVVAMYDTGYEYGWQ